MPSGDLAPATGVIFDYNRTNPANGPGSFVCFPSMKPLDSQTLSCRKCGYDLRGLAAAGRCPECGLPVGESIVVERMDDAPRGWVRTQRLGIWILFTSYALSAVAILSEVFAPYVESIPKPVFTVLRVLPLVLLAVSVWLLTVQRADRRAKKSSLLVRWGFVGVLGLSLVLPAARQGGLESLWGKLGWTLFFALLVTCWIGLGCIQVRIARMLGARWLSPVLWTASILWSIGLLSAASFYLFREYAGRALFSRAETSFVATLLVGGVLLVISSLLVAMRFRSVRKIA